MNNKARPTIPNTPSNTLNTVILKLESDLNFLHRNLNVSHSRFVQLSQLFKSTLDQIVASTALLKRELSSNAPLEEKLKTCDSLMNMAHLMNHSLNVLNPPDIMTVVGNANGIPFTAKPQDQNADFYRRSAPTATMTPDTYAMLKNAQNISHGQVNTRTHDYNKAPIPAAAPFVRSGEATQQPPPRPSSVEMLQQALFSNKERAPQTSVPPNMNASIPSVFKATSVSNPPSVNATSVSTPIIQNQNPSQNTSQPNAQPNAQQTTTQPTTQPKTQPNTRTSHNSHPGIPHHLHNYLSRWDVESFKKFPKTKFVLDKSVETVFQLFDYWYSYIPGQSVPPAAWLLSTYPDFVQLRDEDFLLRRRIINFINGVLTKEPNTSLPKVLAQVESIRLRQTNGSLNELSKLLYERVKKRTPPADTAPSKKPKPNSAEEPMTISSEEDDSELSEIEDFNADDSEPDLNKLISSSIPRERIVKILALKDSPQPLETPLKRSESTNSKASNNPKANNSKANNPKVSSKPAKEDAPSFQMNRDVETVQELWQEWFEGLHGQPSIKSLEERYGSIWRQHSNTEQKFFFGRRKVITTIQLFIEKTEGMTVDEVLQLFENHRKARNFGMKALGKTLSTLPFYELCGQLGVRIHQPTVS